ncbi:hypothetical protein K488DRAFT_86687 [Vararia minispora EC-137]|uniref:Uncharacterized protein n=1 Tax=Vararia minispora EC-137 TaxID=1314806 RepID=A0ACB8QJ01_9AGAM|nr:hypothetical protein K488DRAFT_86687 [Vararia minispora EC-137]
MSTTGETPGSVHDGHDGTGDGDFVGGAESEDKGSHEGEDDSGNAFVTQAGALSAIGIAQEMDLKKWARFCANLLFGGLMLGTVLIFLWVWWHLMQKIVERLFDLLELRADVYVILNLLVVAQFTPAPHAPLADDDTITIVVSRLAYRKGINPSSPPRRASAPPFHARPVLDPATIELSLDVLQNTPLGAHS